MSLESALREELAALEAAGLRRHTTLLDGEATDLVTNDYLGLAGDERIRDAAARAAGDHGAGGRAARLLGGGSPLDAEVESAAAEWLGAEAALLVPSGYQANLGVLGTLAGRGDLILSDKRNHASLIDGAKLSRATVKVFADEEQLLAELRAGAGARRRLIVTEGVFSMDGDTPDLARLAEICLEQDAQLVVDEAHSIGLLGPEGAGAWAACDAPTEALAARVVTGGKALGAAGGLIVGSKLLRENAIHRARSFVFTTAVAPAVAGALTAAIPAAREAERERQNALSLAKHFAASLELPEPAAAIVPIPVGDDTRAVACADHLSRKGFELRAVRPPTVPPGTARLRLVTHAFNTASELDEVASLARELDLPGDFSSPAATGRVLVVVGTDTGIGKTVTSAALLRAATDAGPARYWKPVQTGDDDDTAEVRHLSGGGATETVGFHFALPASPHEAAHAEDDEVDVSVLDAGLERLRQEPGLSIVELAGGLHVPITDDFTQADWLARHKPEVILVARSGLGTLNHTSLTLEALSARGLRPNALVLVGDEHVSNRETLARRSGLPVFEMPHFEDLSPEAVASWVRSAGLKP